MGRKRHHFWRPVTYVCTKLGAEHRAQTPILILHSPAHLRASLDFESRQRGVDPSLTVAVEVDVDDNDDNEQVPERPALANAPITLAPLDEKDIDVDGAWESLVLAAAQLEEHVPMRAHPHWYDTYNDIVASTSGDAEAKRNAVALWIDAVSSHLDLEIVAVDLRRRFDAWKSAYQKQQQQQPAELTGKRPREAMTDPDVATVASADTSRMDLAVAALHELFLEHEATTLQAALEESLDVASLISLKMHAQHTLNVPVLELALNHAIAAAALRASDADADQDLLTSVLGAPALTPEERAAMPGRLGPFYSLFELASSKSNTAPSASSSASSSSS